MSDQFSRARNVMTPWERAELDSTPGLRDEIEANLRSNPFADSPYDAARAMVAIVLRKRQEREERTQRRELVAYIALGVALTASVAVALLTGPPIAGMALMAAVAVAGALLGVTLRSKL